MNTQIATASEEQSHAAEEINRNVSTVAGLSHNLSQQSEAVATAGHELKQLGQELNEAVSEFRH